MAYEEWSDEFQDLWDHTPGTDALESFEEGHAETLFEAGFTHSWDELESMGMTPEDIYAIREEFFDYMGLEEADFDWEGWREAMGYDD